MPEPAIELWPCASDNGLADMIAKLLRQNLLDRPEKQVDFARLRGRVALVAEDAEMALTLHFSGGRARVYDGIHGVPDVVVRGSSEDLLNLSRLPLEPRFRLPDLRDGVARELAKAMRSGRLQAHGALRHLPLLLRLTRIMSIH